MSTQLLCASCGKPFRGEKMRDVGEVCEVRIVHAGCVERAKRSIT